jgi:arsenate reductase
MAQQRPPEILFLCVHNAGRSQMAAAFARAIGGDRVVVHSAGSDPAENLNVAVIAVMKEVGIDITGETPQRLNEQMGLSADVIVTMGCGDACPVYAGKRYVDWDLEDPSNKEVQTVRLIRNEIESRVRALIDELTTSPTSADEA